MAARPKPTNDQVISWWVANAGLHKDAYVEFRKKFLEPKGSVGFSRDGREIRHYGHFAVGRIVQIGNSRRGMFLLNGDLYSGPSGHGPSTSYIQAEVRRLVQATGVPSVIIPFSVIDAAGIDADTIRVVDTTRDTEIPVERWAASYKSIPSWIRESYEYVQRNGGESMSFRNMQQHPDGSWTWTVMQHLLGQSLFRASYHYWDRIHQRDVRRRRLFLSGFDVAEHAGAYFLAELPGRARPATVAEAFEALKPGAVADAELAGLRVLRQGDVFAIPTGLYTDPDVARVLTDHKKYPPQQMAYVLGTNHQATQVKVIGRDTYAKGILHHNPAGRRPDHRRVYLGDRNTWYRLVKNTVPVDVYGQSRAWAPPHGSGRAYVD
jgi:hypothetical protein